MQSFLEVDVLLELMIPSLLDWRHTATRGFNPESPTLHPTGLQRVRCACYGNGCSVASMEFSGHGPAFYAENLHGQWVCTHCLNGATVQKRAARGASTLLARGTGCGSPLGDLAFGTYFPAG